MGVLCSKKSQTLNGTKKMYRYLVPTKTIKNIEGHGINFIVTSLYIREVIGF